MKNDFLNLEKILGIKFSNPKLIEEALTHRSYLNENPREEIRHNERLEFLGDAVLELIVTEFLFHKYPEKKEGELTSLRAALVNANMLAEVAAGLKLEKFLRVSKGEARDSGKCRYFILANALEAAIGAIYLDQGYKEVKKFIEQNICSKISEVFGRKLWRDAKSLFQEKAQEITGITPTYAVLSESGPDHQKHFVIGVYLESEFVAQGEGFSKQEAQMAAAENALKIKNWEDQ